MSVPKEEWCPQAIPISTRMQARRSVQRHPRALGIFGGSFPFFGVPRRTEQVDACRVKLVQRLPQLQHREGLSGHPQQMNRCAAYRC